MAEKEQLDPGTFVAGNTNADVTSTVPVRKLEGVSIPYEVLRIVPEESATHYQLAPIGMQDGVLEVGMVNPDDIEGIDALNFIARKSGMPFKVFRITRDDFARILDMYRGFHGEVDKALTDLATENPNDGNRNVGGDDDVAPLDLDLPQQKKIEDKAGLGAIQEDAPAIKIFSTILRYGIDGSASDVHIEPTNEGVRVRYRVDGELHTSVILPLATQRSLIARVKVLSSMRLDEQRKPQDGRFSATIDNRAIDFRVSTLPSYYGEKVVIRILDRDQGYISLDTIGLTPRNLELMRRALKQPHGIILISGPTGSGKSTTLYSMLEELDREHKNVLSLEDPVEYYVEGVTQSQVRPEIGYTFANGLRTTLRQDPDVIMVGEIRDGETAKLAIQAALTGHLVLTTIHTNDSVGVIPRLIDMGVEPYLIPPTLIVSIAQRLTRTLCEGSGKRRDLTASEIRMIEEEQKTLPPKFRYDIPKAVYDAEATPDCPSGMRGRMAVFEVLEMASDIEKIILSNPVESQLWTAARQQGMLSMREDALIKSADRKVPYSEVTALSGLSLAEEDEMKETPAAEPAVL